MDSLRVESGIPVYGKELNEETSPIEAGLSHLIPKRRWDA
jgi:aminomethyltransferase